MITRSSVKERLFTKKPEKEQRETCYDCRFFKEHGGLGRIPDWCILNDHETTPDEYCDELEKD